jgi:hypothetical protein
MVGRDLARQTVAVVRSYKNPHVARAVGRLLEAGLGWVIIVTDGTQDKGATAGFLGGLLKDARVHYIVMSEGYSWSNALNAAIQCIVQQNFLRRLEEKAEFQFVLSISVEARAMAEQIRKMLEAFAANPQIGVVGATFEGVQNSQRVDLAASYRHGRNTCMAIRLELFQELGHFDPVTDGFGGMEDMNFILYMALASSYRWEVLDLGVQLIVGVHYEQKSKERRERSAMQKIVARWRAVLPLGESRNRLEKKLEEMFGIELKSELFG